MGWPLVTPPSRTAWREQRGREIFVFAYTPPVGEVTRNSTRSCYNPFLLMLAVIAVAVCLSATIVIWRIATVRRMRTSNKAMRNHVRRVY